MENIKTSNTKTEETRCAARKATRYLAENRDKYKVIIYDAGIANDFTDNNFLEDTQDTRILTCAQHAKYNLNYRNLVFCTNDLLCGLYAREFFYLNVERIEENPVEKYKGYVEKRLLDGEMADFYSSITENTFDLLTNQYLLLENTNGEVVDRLKWNGKIYESIRRKPFKSQMFGTLKPLDDIQNFAMDSLETNDITVLYGKAGTGKTTLPLNYIMQNLEKQKFSKCYFIYSYEPLKGARTLGFEKGDHMTKLLQSASIGNILSSKFGDLQQVERMMDLGMIDIIPTANIRGVQFPSDSCVMVTECQNLDVYTIKTIIQRCKEGCKQIYEGDIVEQKDTKISDDGMARLIDVFKGHTGFGCIELKNNYRSELSEFADRL